MVAIVVPCYNEAARLQASAFTRFVAEHRGIEFLFVNDGSTDDTLPLLESICRQSPERLHVVNLPRNSGKGEAVRQGVLAALARRPAVVGFWDADLATPLSAIPELVGQLDSHSTVEIVMGARVRLMGRTIRRRAVRHYVGRVFATAASLVLGIAVYDTQCGAKVFRVTPTTAALFAAPFLSHWIFDVELIARRLAGCTPEQRATADTLIIEYPLTAWQDVRGSKLGPTSVLAAGLDLVRILIRYRLRPGGHP